MTEQENARRINGLEARMEQIDQHGTRGMESVRTQLGLVQRDMGKMESAVDRVETAMQSMQLQLAGLRPRSWWPQMLGYLGIIVPTWALVIDLIARQH